MYSYDRRRTAARPIPIDKGQARKLAKRVVKELPWALKFRPDDMDSAMWMARGFHPDRWGFILGVYKTTDVREKPVNVPIRLGAAKAGAWKGPRKWVAGGSVSAKHFGPKEYGSKTGLGINLNSNRTPNEILNNLGEVADELYSVIIHEVTHLRDLLLPTQSADGDGPESYHNRPTEVRAFMQQIADEALTDAHAQGKDDGGWLFTGRGPTSEFIDSLLDRSPTWERIGSTLNRRNQQLILKGVTRAIQDEWGTLQRMYPEEVDPDDDWDPSKEPLPLP
jgi:hypothetical protein